MSSLPGDIMDLLEILRGTLRDFRKSRHYLKEIVTVQMVDFGEGCELKNLSFPVNNLQPEFNNLDASQRVQLGMLKGKNLSLKCRVFGLFD